MLTNTTLSGGGTNSYLRTKKQNETNKQTKPKNCCKTNIVKTAILFSLSDLIALSSWRLIESGIGIRFAHNPIFKRNSSRWSYKIFTSWKLSTEILLYTVQRLWFTFSHNLLFVVCGKQWVFLYCYFSVTVIKYCNQKQVIDLHLQRNKSPLWQGGMAAGAGS